MDYAGSFDRKDVIEHLVANECFRLKDEKSSALRTIVDNEFTDGGNVYGEYR